VFHGLFAGLIKGFDVTEKLIDPSLDKFHLFDEEDGWIKRNDGRKFLPAEKNPFYVLATVFGEAEHGVFGWRIAPEIDVKNRRAWNGLACAGLNDDERRTLAHKLKLDVGDLMPLSAEEKGEISTLFQTRMDTDRKLPDASEFISMSRTVFLKTLTFEKRYFPTIVFFNSCHFAETVNFTSSVFGSKAYFTFGHFEGTAKFFSNYFEGDADFKSTRFQSSVDFGSSYFTHKANFVSCHFIGPAKFIASRFAGYAKFEFSRFASRARFEASYFANYSNFCSIVTSGETSFEHAKFKTNVPKFHAATLYRDTVFPTAEPASLNYPEIMPTGKELVGDVPYMSATEQKRAYNTLRYFMNQNLEIDQELFFHRREMACKEVTEDAFVGWLIWFYGRLSAYGSSIARPLIGLVMIWFVGALLLQFHFTSDPKLSIMGDFWSAMGISFSNTFGIFGLGGTLLSKFNADTVGWIKGVSGFQTVFGFIFLFLLGLGIRSRFRLR
jgi:hypothetical protein